MAATKKAKPQIKKAPKKGASHKNVKADALPILGSEAKAFVSENTEHGISLKDRILLAIKNGAEYSAQVLGKLLVVQIPQELLKSSASTAAGEKPKGALRAMLVAALHALRKDKLINLKDLPDNLTWNDAAKIQLAPPKPDSRFEIDPQFQNLLPPQKPEELAELTRQLIIEGCHDPLRTWEDGPKTLLADGQTRLKVCLRHGIPYTIKPLNLPDRQAVVDWIWDHHYGRRNFTEQAASYRRGLRFNADKLARGGDRKSKSHDATLKKAAKALAAAYEVDRATLFRDGTFAEAVDIIVDSCGEDGAKFRQRLLSGDIHLPRRKVSKLAEENKRPMQALVKQLLDDGKLKLEADKTGKGGTFLRVALPFSNPAEQAQMLLKALKAKKTAKLIDELKKLLEATEKTVDDKTDELLRLDEEEEPDNHLNDLVPIDETELAKTEQSDGSEAKDAGALA